MPGQLDCRNRVSTNPGNHPVARVRQSASAIGGPPGSIPAARAGAVYLRSVLRSTPKLTASSFCDRPAYQWIKISTISIMSKVLLVTCAPPRCSATRTEPVVLRGPDRHDTHALPLGNYVIAG